MPTLPETAAAATAVATVHVHLQVPDLAAAVAFYRAFFGQGPVKERPGYAKFLPSWAPLNLALSAGGQTAHGGMSHLGIQLHDPALVRQHLARVQAAGLYTRVEMGVDCCYANQDKFWVRDPAGVEWEVYHLNHDMDQDGGLPEPATAAPAACCAPSCCK